MKHPFDYHRPTTEQVEQISTIREGCKALHDLILTLPSSRERSVAITKLEEVSMWANKSVIMSNEGEIQTKDRLPALSQSGIGASYFDTEK